MSKKNFKVDIDSPAMSFISDSKKNTKNHDGYKVNHEFIETKSKRIQVLIQQTLKDDAKKAAQEQGISLNELVCKAIKEYIKK